MWDQQTGLAALSFFGAWFCYILVWCRPAARAGRQPTSQEEPGVQEGRGETGQQP